MAFSDKDSARYIWRMTCMSPLVKQRFDAQDYRFHLLTDEDNLEEILHDLLGSFLQDLEDIGISFAANVSELYQSDQTLEDFLDLCEYLFPSYLYLTLRGCPTLREGVFYILDSDTKDGSLLTEWLEYLARYKPELENIIEEFLPHFVGSGLFNDYLAGLNAHIEDQHIQLIMDDHKLHRIDAFLTKLKSGRDKLTRIPIDNTIVKIIDGHITTVEHLVRDPDFASKFGSWLGFRLNELPKAYIPFYLKLSKSILASIPLMVNYYLARLVPAELLVADEYAISTTLFGWACNKYHPKRYAKIFGDKVTYLQDVILKELTSE